MEKLDRINVHDQYAQGYDDLVRELNYWLHHAAFGLFYEYINKGEKLLDLGIGTGLSSSLFASYGMEIHGIDGSEKMLENCRSKGFAKDLQCYDLAQMPWPYSNKYFDHTIALGLFNFFPELESLFREVNRILKSSGLFGFVIEQNQNYSLAARSIENVPEYTSRMSYGVEVFMHNKTYIYRTLSNTGFEILKELTIVPEIGEAGVLQSFFLTRKK